MYKNKSLGIYGEDTAAKYLEANGYIILTTNYRCKMGEIDIIAADGDTIVFIEVKTRSTDKYGQPREFVNHSKQIKIIKTALHYMVSKKLTDYMSRFDIVDILVDNNNSSNNAITLIKNAFEYSGKYGY
jgi:putative endonuclease